MLVINPPAGDRLRFGLVLSGKWQTGLSAGSERISANVVWRTATTILGLGIDRSREVQTVRAFNKLLWLQNDLINCHYQHNRQTAQTV
jgi:hypothetical protein